MASLHAQAPPKPNRAANTVTLDEMSVKNIGITTVEAETADFEETVFSLGRIEALPENTAVVSTRIQGRAKTIIGRKDMKCEAGDELLWVESRQPGDPPPVIRVDAPIGGIIANVKVVQGQPVGPDDSLMEIYDLSTVEAAAAVPEHLAGKLTKDLEAHIRVPGFPDRVWEAKLAHIGASADAASGTVEAAFHVANADGVLRPEMRAEFSIVISKREEVMSIPREALQGDPTSRFVYIRDYELKYAFVKTPIVTGAMNDRFVEVKEGLLPGDEVVTKGAYSLAYAGKGSVSLKEALDAAHGHPHNEDGSEMTKDQIAARAAGGTGAAQAEAGPFSAPLTKLFAASTVVLLVLLTLISLRRAPSPSSPSAPHAQ